VFGLNGPSFGGYAQRRRLAAFAEPAEYGDAAPLRTLARDTLEQSFRHAALEINHPTATATSTSTATTPRGGDGLTGAPGLGSGSFGAGQGGYSEQALYHN
jgi:hypothetical protein